MPARKKAESTVPFADVRMELMSSRQIQEYQRRSDLVVLPIGCFEMHGPLVPLGCDSFIDWATGLLLAREWGCPCLPPIFYTFPGASGPWPGTVDISNRATMDYIEAVLTATLKNGFGRPVVVGCHGPLGSMMACVMGDLLRATGRAIVHVRPYGRLIQKMEEDGVPFGEPGVVLASMKLLGLDGVFDPAARADRPMEFPLPSIQGLRQCHAQMPWIFAKDYQHTGINRRLKAEHADRIAASMAAVAREMKDLPRHYAQYQREMDRLFKDKPWADRTAWTRTR